MATILMRGVGWGTGATATGGLTPQEKRGKQIYLRGVSPSERKITALMSGLEVPATTLPCANCHGYDGRGKPEAGVTPSDLTWEFLTKPYGVTHASGRTHPPYTEQRIGRAIVEGVDPAGNRLLPTMPRYLLAPDDLADLTAYLKRLGKDLDPGLTETQIRLGTILPVSGPLAEMGQAMRAVMTAYFDELNRQGGIYHRKIELSVMEPAETPAATRTGAQRWIEKEPIFALVGAFIAGAEQEIASLLESEELPLVGPLTLFPPIGSPPNRYVFYLLSGMREQARALVDFATQRLSPPHPRMAILFPQEKIPLEVPEAIEEQSRRLGWSSVARVRYPSGRFNAAQLVQQLRQEDTQVLFLLGSEGEGRALMQEAAKANWTPHILLPGSLVGKEIFDLPMSFQEKIFLSYPTIPSDQTRVGLLEYRALLERHPLPGRHLAAQLSAYCAAKVLVEGLKLAGRDLSREKLITVLEGLYEFDTGLTPQITFGPNRRIGALGAYIVGLDLGKKAFIPISPWVTPQ
ncbi:MAG: ABC transporter substrate-binding protein [Candidatus Tectomicrobia bacterium]|uniref:ABC transporter substrate-binding protein n=1 Tax=Tectimicrobiota bacterium TaxID=2528274 RepID=A0A932CMP2_UNCTE|nr:ABC transporter substrate-binding protein [Candidatus Tectomicrobia bacterium]